MAPLAAVKSQSAQTGKMRRKYNGTEVLWR